MKINSNKIIKVHGHRGCRGLLPENTMPSFYRAIDLGVDAIEIDVLFTKDKKLIVSHDPYMASEICSKPNGCTISKEEEQGLNIYKMTLKEAQTYICGSFPHPRFEKQQQIKSFKPSFQEFVEGVANYCEQHKKSFPILNIEIKSEPQWDNIFHPEPEEYAALFFKEFNHSRMKEYSLIQSFDARILKSIQGLHQGVRLMLLSDENRSSTEEILSVLPFKPFGYCPNYKNVNRETIQYCGDNGIELTVWTVNDENEMSRLLDMGVKNIITDYPNRFFDLINRIDS